MIFAFFVVSTNILRHEPLVEVRSQEIIHKLLLSLHFGAPGLVPEHHVIVPSSFRRGISVRVHERIAICHLLLPLVLFLRGFLLVLLCFTFRPFLFDLLELP